MITCTKRRKELNASKIARKVAYEKMSNLSEFQQDVTRVISKCSPHSDMTSHNFCVGLVFGEVFIYFEKSPLYSKLLG